MMRRAVRYYRVCIFAAVIALMSVAIIVSVRSEFPGQLDSPMLLK